MMYSATMITCVATALLTIANGQQLTSPCPRVFSYEPIQSDTDRWHGNIHLNTDVELNSVWIDIELNRPAELLGNWFGEVTSNDNKVFTITNRKKKLQPGSSMQVRIFVKYSLIEPIPFVQSIHLNGRSICAQPGNNRGPSSSTTTTSTTTTTTYRPVYTKPRPTQGSIYPTVNPNKFENHGEDGYLNQNYNVGRPTKATTKYDWVTIVPPVSDSDEGFEGDFHAANKRPLARPNPNKNPVFSDSYQGQCGVIAAQAKPLITHGQETKEGQWPWHAALYRSKGIDLSYICGASLVTPRYVITAAHCVTRKQSERVIDKQSLQIYLGKFNLRVWNSESIQVIPVEEIIIHPEYNHSNFNSDVAILKLSRNAQITMWVRPVCLWQENTNLSSIIDREGTVVGWGYDETGHVTEQLTQANMPVVEPQICIWSYPEFFSKFTSDRTYCAGFRNGTSVCNGDSGGGMVFPRPNTNPPVWQLRGLVSISVALQNEYVCDASHYVVFTDLAKHLSWINDVLS